MNEMMKEGLEQANKLNNKFVSQVVFEDLMKGLEDICVTVKVPARVLSGDLRAYVLKADW